jgi:hypothetical protein
MLFSTVEIQSAALHHEKSERIEAPIPPPSSFGWRNCLTKDVDWPQKAGQSRLSRGIALAGRQTRFSQISNLPTI